jgi:hypothetical protein
MTMNTLSCLSRHNEVVKRERAMQLAEHVLHLLDQGQSQWPLSLVSELHVFGSFARGASEPRDLDIDVEHKTDRRWAAHFVNCMEYGRDPYSPLKRALTGGKRGCQFTFNFRDSADFDMTLLWREGDLVASALDRLQAMELDPSAGRAPRHAMLPQFEGLDVWIPRPYREALRDAINSGAITLERVLLADGDVTSPIARRHLRHRWTPSSPLYRAACAVLADWEQRGLDPGQGHLHGSDVRDKDTPYFAGFGLRYFPSIPDCLTEYGGVEWLEVVHPTRSRPLHSLRILPRDRQALRRARMDW